MDRKDWQRIGRKLPPLALSLLIAELFFKLKSFTLECLAFLTLWFVLNWLYGLILGEQRSANRSWFA